MSLHATRRRRGWLAIALTLAAVPVAAQAPGGRAPPPLDVELYTPHAGRLRFALGDSAYVVVFELQPGRGARVLYPAADAPESRLGPGWHQPAWPATDPLAGRRGAFPEPRTRARALYLVASRAPLGLPPARRTPAALEAATGPFVFQGTELSRLASALVRGVLTVPRDAAAWVDAMAYYEPGVADPLSAGTRPVVRCPDGREYVLRSSDAQPFVCP